MEDNSGDGGFKRYSAGEAYDIELSQPTYINRWKTIFTGQLQREALRAMIMGPP